VEYNGRIIKECTWGSLERTDNKIQKIDVIDIF